MCTMEKLRSPWTPALCRQPAGTFTTACAAHCLQGLNQGSEAFATKMFSKHFSSRSVLQFNSPLPGTPHPAEWFYSRLHEKPHRRLGEQPVTFVKTGIRSLKNPTHRPIPSVHCASAPSAQSSLNANINLQGSSN